MSDLAEMVAVEECMLICAEQIKIGSEYVNVDKEKLECDCSRTVITSCCFYTFIPMGIREFNF